RRPRRRRDRRRRPGTVVERRNGRRGFRAEDDRGRHPRRRRRVPRRLRLCPHAGQRSGGPDQVRQHRGRDALRTHRTAQLAGGHCTNTTESRRAVSTLNVAEQTFAELVERARALALRGDRVVLGITGAPGAGKSTLAERLVAELGEELSVLVPMDGFHLADAVLHALGRRDRKGADDTFDAWGYVALMQRIRAQRDGASEGRED